MHSRWGSEVTPPVGVKRTKTLAENGFRARHSAEMSSKNRQLLLLVAFFFQKNQIM